MTTTETKSLLRAEAQLFPWKELAEDQQQALRRLIDLLAALSSAAPSEPKKPLQPAWLPQIDAERHSSVVLIDGDRGTGKTSVFLSAIEILRAEFQKDAEAVRRYLDDDEAIKKLHAFAYPVVPLGILDLAPLPDETELLPWLAQRLYSVVGRTADNHDDSFAADDVETAWDAVIRSAVLGWDGNLGARKGSLDASAYIYEVKDAAGQRSEVPIAWRRFIDVLVKHTQKTQQLNKPPIFLIPIDDADLKPALTSKLVSLLRTCAHERVVFLLTGHLDQFEMALEREFGEQLLPSRDVVTSERSAAPARLAHATLQKLVPAHNRLHLKRLLPSEAFKRLRPLLKTISLPPNRPDLETLADLLEAHPEAQAAIPSLLRSIADEEHHLRGPTPPNVDSVIKRWFDSAVRDLPREHQSPVDSLLGSPAGSGGSLVPEFASIEFSSIEMGLVGATGSYKVSVDVVGKRTTSVDYNISVSDSIYSCMLLAADISFLLGRRIETPKSTAFSVVINRKSKLHWPTPDFDLSFEISEIFRKALSTKHGAELEPPIERFIHACLRSRKEITPSKPWSWMDEQLRETLASPMSPESRWARRNLLWFCMPESGLNTNISNSLFSAVIDAIEPIEKNLDLWKQETHKTREDFLPIDTIKQIDASAPPSSSLRWLKSLAPAEHQRKLFTLFERVKTRSDRQFPPFNLQPYISSSTIWKPLAASESEILRHSEARLEALSGADGGALTAIQSLATAAASAEPDNSSLARLARQANFPDERPISSLYGPLDGRTIHGTGTLHHWHGIRPHNTQVEINISAAGEASVTGTPPPSPLETSIALILNDFFADEWDQETIEGTMVDTLVEYHAFVRARTRIPGITFDVAWDFPSWRSTLDYRILSTIWNAAFTQANEITKGARQQTVDQVVDSLSFCLIGAICNTFKFRSSELSVIENRGLPLTINLNIRPTLWAQIAQISSDKNHIKGLRHLSFRHWQENILPLYATPEQGLSASAALAMLHAWSPTIEQREHWKHLRLQRLRASLAAARSSSSYERALKLLRKSFTDHPWYQIVDPE